jgi:hypothetical protein
MPEKSGIYEKSMTPGGRAIRVLSVEIHAAP